MSLPSGVYAGIFAGSRRDSHGAPVRISLGMPVRRFVPGSQREFDRDPRADKNEQTKLNEIRFCQWSHQSNISLPPHFPLPLSFFRERSEVSTTLEFANCIWIHSQVWKKSAFAKTLVWLMLTAVCRLCIFFCRWFFPPLPNSHHLSQVFPLITDLINSQHYLVSCANFYFSYFHNS